MKKIALVTGAGRGIGRAVALALAKDGWDVALHCCRSRTAAEDAATEIRALGRNAAVVCADLTDAAATAACVAAAAAELGPISLLVNNAGVAFEGLFQDTDETVWRHLFAVNVDGAYRCIRAVLPDMLHEKAGGIINISSVWGQRGASCEVGYSAAKGALIALTRSLAAELAPSNIRVNAVAPGCVDTDMLRALGEETCRTLAAQTPLGRLGTPEDVAAAVVFLAGDNAAFFTGQVLTADGGFTL